MDSVLITGANRSIGLETAKQLSEKGLFVYLGSRDLQKGEEVVKELTQNGFKNIKAIQIDVTNPESILEAKNSIEKEQGKLDILINNAGILGDVPQDSSNTSIENIQKTFDTNFFGVIRVTQTFLELLKNLKTLESAILLLDLAHLHFTVILHGNIMQLKPFRMFHLKQL